MMLIRLCSPELNCSSSAVLHRLELIERAVKNGTVSAGKVWPETKTEKKLPEKPVKESFVEEVASPAGPAVLYEKWPEVVETLHGISPGLAAFLENSKAYTQGDYFLIDAPNSAAFELLRSHPEQKEKMRRAIQIVAGRIYRLGPYKAEKTEEKMETDPLEKLMGLAADAGIEVTKK